MNICASGGPANWRYRHSRVDGTALVLCPSMPCENDGPGTGDVSGQWRSANVSVKVLAKKTQYRQEVMTMANIMRLINNPKFILLLQVIESETIL